MISTMTEIAIAGEDHSLTGAGDSAAGRFLDGHREREMLAVSGDDEQGVVNAHT